MKLSLLSAFIFTLFLGEGTASGLRHLKLDGIDYGSIHLNDEFAPSFAPSATPLDPPTQSPSSSPSISLAPSISMAPTEAPSSVPVTSTTITGDSGSDRSFMIEIKFDGNAKENSWHLFSGSDQLKDSIYSVDFGEIQTWGVYRTTFENMPAGTYTFVIADIGNNGISSGRMAIYQLIDGQEDKLVWKRDGNFGFLVEKGFVIV